MRAGPVATPPPRSVDTIPPPPIAFASLRSRQFAAPDQHENARMKMVARRANAYLPPRQQQLRATMAKANLDGILLTHPPDLTYLTDFTGDDSIGLITAKDFFLATDFRYKEQAAIEAPWLKIRLRTAKMSDLLAEVLAAAKLKRVGFESNFTTFGEIDSLRKALKAKS